MAIYWFQRVSSIGYEGISLIIGMVVLPCVLHMLTPPPTPHPPHPTDKMSAISQTTFSNVFSWVEFLYFDSNFTEVCVPKGPIDKKQHWFR